MQFNYVKLMYKIFIDDNYIKGIDSTLLNMIVNQLCKVPKYDPKFIMQRFNKIK